MRRTLIGMSPKAPLVDPDSFSRRCAPCRAAGRWTSSSSYSTSHGGSARSDGRSPIYPSASCGSACASSPTPACSVARLIPDRPSRPRSRHQPGRRRSRPDRRASVSARACGPQRNVDATTPLHDRSLTGAAAAVRSRGPSSRGTAVIAQAILSSDPGITRTRSCPVSRPVQCTPRSP